MFTIAGGIVLAVLILVFFPLILALGAWALRITGSFWRRPSWYGASAVCLSTNSWAC